MKNIKKLFKMIGLAIVGVIALIILIAFLFINISPEFGRTPTKAQKAEYAKSPHHQNGIFVNTQSSEMNLDYWKLIKEMLRTAPERQPSKNITVEKIDSVNITNHTDSITQLTWFGHSAFLVEMEGKKILLDPMFGDVPAPHPWLGRPRYSKELPIEIEKLPFIDAVIFSHDHYDHLDYGSVQRLKGKVGKFLTPLGVGNHLLEWGVPQAQIEEYNWWEETQLDDIQVVCTPARHFSGRGLTDRASTLWASWVIKGTSENIYFSGDSGYGDHFKEIGDKYGPFDISLMECGQYNKDWQAIHMLPEETAQAGVDLQSQLILPIHWGAFTLAFHSWTDPIERVTKKAAALDIAVTTPKIGEVVVVGKETFPAEKWWLGF